MPAGAYHECRYPRCPNYAERGGYCAEHRAAARELPSEIARDAPLGHFEKARFRRLRHSFLIRHPLCARCREPATILDHIRPHRGVVALFWDQTNWQTLCARCHGRKTALELWGKGS
jgi:5-methylcytosine-specific restriction protein A